jgi:hypothetical protein
MIHLHLFPLNILQSVGLRCFLLETLLFPAEHFMNETLLVGGASPLEKRQRSNIIKTHQKGKMEIE